MFPSSLRAKRFAAFGANGSPSFVPPLSELNSSWLTLPSELAGPDVAEVVIQRFRWLMAGRIRHVMVVAPMDNPFVAQAATAWKGEGMIFGGVLPNLMGTDAMCYQGVRDVDLRPDQIRVIEPLAVKIRDRALEDWRFARDIDLVEPTFDGIAAISATL